MQSSEFRGSGSGNVWEEGIVRGTVFSIQGKGMYDKHVVIFITYIQDLRDSI